MSELSAPTAASPDPSAPFLKQQGSRLPQLDALRGLAAFSVYLWHAFGMAPQQPKLLDAIYHTPLRFFYNGSAAVLLFFTLSGFVLAFSYTDGRPRRPGWAGSFIIRRIFRIYPAFLGAMAFTILLRTCLFRPEWVHGFSTWFSGYWQEPVPWGRVANSLLLVGSNKHSTFIDPPVWSLTFEMRISLLFPLIILIVTPARRSLWDFALLVAIYLLSLLLLPFSETLDYLPLFVLGAMCAKYFTRVKPLIGTLNGPFMAALILGSLALYGINAVFDGQHLAPRLNFLITQLTGLGAAGLILISAASLNSPTNPLCSRSCQFLGRISYSFYLIHLPILIAIAPLIYFATGSLVIAWLVSLALSFFLSEVFFRWLEMPGIRLGSIVANSYTRRWPAARLGVRPAPGTDRAQID